MPYKDPGKRREAIRKSKEKAKERKVQKAADDDILVEALPENELLVSMETLDELPDDERQAMEQRFIKSLKGKTGGVWACIVYLDSLPDDWEELLRMQGVIAAVSPLHDKDTYIDKNDQEQLKKPHYHVIIMKRNGGKYTFNTATAISRGLLHGTYPILVVSPRGYYRYFTHADHPNKYQYDKKDIIHINDFSLLDMGELSEAEKIAISKKLYQAIAEWQMTDYKQFVDYLIVNCNDDEYHLAVKGSNYRPGFIAYLNAMNKTGQAKQIANLESKVKNLEAQLERQIKVTTSLIDAIQGNEPVLKGHKEKNSVIRQFVEKRDKQKQEEQENGQEE